MIRAPPLLAHEAACRPVRELRARWEVVLNLLERGADLVSELLEPCARGKLTVVQFVGAHGSHLLELARHAASLGCLDGVLRLDMISSRPARREAPPRHDR